MIKHGDFDGSFVLTDEPHRRYIARTPTNHPFCHCCRKRADLVTVVVPVSTSNPFHVCKACLKAISDGIEVVENEVKRIQNGTGAAASA